MLTAANNSDIPETSQHALPDSATGPQAGIQEQTRGLVVGLAYGSRASDALARSMYFVGKPL